jgi:hypothetical protein
LCFDLLAVFQGVEGAPCEVSFQIVACYRPTGPLFGHDDYPRYMVSQFTTVSASDGNY